MGYPKIKYYDIHNFHLLPPLQKLPLSYLSAMKAVALVLPFRSNNYIVDNLIDWHNIPDDPIFRLTFPHPDMLPNKILKHLIQLQETNRQEKLNHFKESQMWYD